MNILERKFVLFGLVFWPPGFLPLLPGHADHRHLCGVVSPPSGGGCSVDGYVGQTIFMEMRFRKDRYWIEGDFQQQRKL